MPQQRGVLKAQNFMAWPKQSLEAIFAFMACSLGSTYTWVDLGLDKFAASYNSPCFQWSSMGNSKVYIQVFRSHFFLKEYLSNSNLVPYPSSLGH